MSRLRHPVRAIREPFGKAGLVIAILALVMALVGGAYAAGGLTKSQEKQVTKIAKRYAGKPGAPGAVGTAGTNGTNGKDGAPGAPGKDGEDGQDGAPGVNGKSVLTTEITTAGLEGKCVGTGGTKVEVEGNAASKKYICNGKDGETGFTETLPSGKTETGVYSVAGEEEGVAGFGASIKEGQKVAVMASFSIPVEPEPTFVFVPGPAAGGFGSNSVAGCPGVTAAGLPQADSGKFCVYGISLEVLGFELPAATATTSSPASTEGSPGVTPAGTTLELQCTSAIEYCRASGVWAVTG